MPIKETKESRVFQSVYESDIKLSISKLRLCLQHMYERGRESVSRKPFSIVEAFAGAFVAELVTALVYLFGSETPEIILKGVIEKPLVIHVIATVVLGVLTAGAYFFKGAMLYENETDTDRRDRAVTSEINDLCWEPEYTED